MTYPQVHFRHIHTGEVVAAMILGHTSDRRPIIENPGSKWTLESRYLADHGVHEPLGYSRSTGGVYVLQSVEEAEAEMHR